MNGHLNVSLLGIPQIQKLTAFTTLQHIDFSNLFMSSSLSEKIMFPNLFFLAM